MREAVWLTVRAVSAPSGREAAMGADATVEGQYLPCVRTAAVADATAARQCLERDNVASLLQYPEYAHKPVGAREQSPHIGRACACPSSCFRL